jgi:hypothetical protein
VQFNRMEVEIRKDPPDLPVFSLHQADFQGPPPRSLDLSGLVPFPLHHQPLDKSVYYRIRYGAGGFHQVFLLKARRGMAHPGGEIPVIGKEDEAGRTEVQTADIVKPLPDAGGQQF